MIKPSKMRIPLRRLPRSLGAATITTTTPSSISSRICLNCRRPYSSSTSSHAPNTPTSVGGGGGGSGALPSGLAPLSSRKLIAVAGADAAKFLQGIITANILTGDGGAQRTDPFYAGFLNATGRVLNDVFIYPDPESGGFLIETDAGQQDALARYIKRYKLRAKVTVRKLDEGEMGVWQAWGGSTTTTTTTSDAEPPAPPNGLVFKDHRAPGLGFRILQPGGGAPALDLDLATEEAYTVRRYLNGVPEGQDEILRETALPQESNMDFMGGIDYHKGCYVGQELTIRTKHRGVVRKRILPCVVYDKHTAPPETLHYNPEGTVSLAAASGPAEALTADMIPLDTSIGRCGKRGRSAGKWLRGVGNIGLGLCRLEIMTGVQLPGETAAAAFHPDDEFMLEWGGDDADGTRSGVKVKAFVPDWVRAGLDATAPR